MGEANCKGVTQSGDAKPGWGKGSGSTQKAGRRRRATQKGDAEGRRRKGDLATQKGDAERATGQRRRATQRAKAQDDTLIDGGYAKKIDWLRCGENLKRTVRMNCRHIHQVKYQEYECLVEEVDNYAEDRLG